MYVKLNVLEIKAKKWCDLQTAPAAWVYTFHDTQDACNISNFQHNT